MLRTQVLIIGGGPTGLTAALCLARGGVSSVVLEKRETWGRHPKAHEVSARTLEILTQLGIPFRELTAEASPHEDASRVLFCRTLNEEIGRIDLNEKSIRDKYAAHTALPRPYLNLSQTELEKILRRHVTKNKLITLLTGTEWKALRQNTGGVTSIAQRKHTRGGLEIRSDYVLCCDGAGGKCRDFLGIRMSGPEKIQDFANAYFTDDLRGHLATPAKLFFIFKPDAVGTFIAHHAGRRWVYHVPVITPHERIEDFTEEVFRRRIRSAVGDPNYNPRIESISSWRMTAQVAETFQSGRVFLAGDAAHRFPPTGGLGLNSGVADAHNLCWKLAAVLRGEADADLLSTYEKERKPVSEHNCEESRKNYFNLFKIPASLGLNARALPFIMAVLAAPPLRWLGRKFRNGVLTLLYRLADSRLTRFRGNTALHQQVKNVIAGETSHFDRIGLDLGYHYGSTNSNESDTTLYRPDFSPGARWPVFYFTKSGKKVCSHTFTDYAQFTLFVPESAVQTWRRSTADFGENLPLKIFPVPEKIRLGAESASFMVAAGIATNGGILVRPDGHIALRCAVLGDLTGFFGEFAYNLVARRIAS